MHSTIPGWIENDLSFWLGLTLFLLLPFELLRRYRAKQLTRASLLEMGASTSPFIFTVLASGLTISFITALFSSAATLAPWEIKTTWLSAIGAILLVDFLYYIDHRCGHVVRVYWAISHSVHHSSPQYDQTTGLRVSFVDGFLSPWFYLPAVLLGFDPLLVAAALGLIIAYQQWLHTETIGHLKWLDGWLNTPSNHRVHHGSQLQYLDKNYGAVLMIWDRLFGTYERENVPVSYGLRTPINSANPWQVHFCELFRLIVDLKTATNWRTAIGYLLRPPGWQPAGSANVSLQTASGVSKAEP